MSLVIISQITVSRICIKLDLHTTVYQTISREFFCMMPGMKGLPGDTRVKEEDEEKNATKNEQGKIELLSWKAEMSNF